MELKARIWAELVKLRGGNLSLQLRLWIEGKVMRQNFELEAGAGSW